jgi:hypothetical protein
LKAIGELVGGNAHSIWKAGANLFAGNN